VRAHAGGGPRRPRAVAGARARLSSWCRPRLPRLLSLRLGWGLLEEIFCVQCMFALLKGYSECKMSVDQVTEEQHEATLRERKKLATQRALRVHALELFAAKGFSKVTVEDIAAAADVSPRTFFNYFPSKEAVLFGTDLHRAETIRRQVVEQPPALSPLEAIGAVFARQAEEMGEELRELGRDPRELFELMKAASDDPGFRAARAAQMAIVERALAEALAERLGTDPERDAYPFLLASCAVAAVRTAIFFWASRGGDVPLADLAKAALASLGQGLEHGCRPLCHVLRKGERTK
jgi:AcrR family transcriptional regulator